MKNKKQLIIFVIFSAFTTLVFSPIPVAAQDIEFRPQVSIPGSEFEVGGTARPVASEQGGVLIADLLPRYIKAIYQFGVWVAIILAIFMMMVGGFIWMLAGGSQERVSNAKSYISYALTGLVIALISFVILQTVNPDTVNLKGLKIEVVNPAEIGKDCCFNKSTDQAVGVTLQEGEKCEGISPQWSACELYTACVCVERLRIDPSTSNSIDCKNNIDPGVCRKGSTPPPESNVGKQSWTDCQPIPNKVCQQIQNEGKQGYTFPDGQWWFGDFF